MIKQKQNIIDRLVTTFSEANLKKRVWTVMGIGFTLCVIIIIIGYFFLNQQFKVTPEAEPQPYWKLLWIRK